MNFKTLQISGIFEAIWGETLKIYHNKKGINWSWQVIDVSIVFVAANQHKSLSRSE